MTILDGLDILVVAGIIYSLMLTLHNAQSRLIAVGILVLALFYVLVLTAGLRLATFLFNTVFAATVVALVVVFQKELRDYFGRVTMWLLSFRKEQREGVSSIDLLCDTMFDLAAQRTGALVVLPGDQELGDFLVGGTPLDGRISEPLLHSIFDPNSPGHDGALLITGERVHRFGCHLPLSTNMEALEGRGTRHAAALGLSELTDAMCIVVSEERGTVSITLNGELKPVTREQLAAAIDEFQKSTPIVPDGPSGIRRFLVYQLPMQILAIAIAFGMWFFVVRESVIEYETVTVPVRIVDLESRTPRTHSGTPRVRVVVSGPRRAFYFVEPEDFAISVPIVEESPGTQEITLTASDVTAPPNLSIINIFPRTITVTLENQSP